MSGTSARTAMEVQDTLSFVEKLAQFFPHAVPVRIAVRVSGNTISGHPFSERTIIEYSTAREVVFGSHLPLEFADKFRLETVDGAHKTEASVIALHYYEGSTTAVAARLDTEITNWVPKK